MVSGKHIASDACTLCRPSDHQVWSRCSVGCRCDYLVVLFASSFSPGWSSQQCRQPTCPTVPHRGSPSAQSKPLSPLPDLGGCPAPSESRPRPSQLHELDSPAGRGESQQGWKRGGRSSSRCPCSRRHSERHTGLLNPPIRGDNLLRDWICNYQLRELSISLRTSQKVHLFLIPSSLTLKFTGIFTSCLVVKPIIISSAASIYKRPAGAILKGPIYRFPITRSSDSGLLLTSVVRSSRDCN